MSYWIPACAGMTNTIVSGQALINANAMSYQDQICLSYTLVHTVEVADKSRYGSPIYSVG
jgi:hypothetical protein